MRMKPVIALAAASVVAGAVMSPVPAHAASGYARCPAGYLCTFNKSAGNGKMAYFKYGTPNLRQQGMDNAVWSISNKTGRYVCAYAGYNYTGSWLLDGYYPKPGQSGNLPNNVANRMSSLRLISSGHC